MSSFMELTLASNVISTTAAEEALRRGQLTIGVDDLLLALVGDEQIAGQVLRSLGITLEAARAAVATQHADQLASLGIRSEAPEPREGTIRQAHHAKMGERAREILAKAKGDELGYPPAVLRKLIAEPSGLIAAVLDRLDTTPDAVCIRLTEAASFPALERYSRIDRTPSGISSTTEIFVPAGVAQVWELLANPPACLSGSSASTASPTWPHRRARSASDRGGRHSIGSRAGWQADKG